MPGHIGEEHVLCHTTSGSRITRVRSEVSQETLEGLQRACDPPDFPPTAVLQGQPCFCSQVAYTGRAAAYLMPAMPGQRVPGGGVGLPHHRGTPAERDSLEGREMGAGWVRFITSEL